VIAVFGSQPVLPEASGKPLWIDADAIAARLRELGYGDVKLERSNKEIEIVASRADRQATVLRMNGKNAAATELLESIHAKQGYAVARHESALCAVRVQRVGAGTDPAASRALLAELF
jgi:hypothetical protein